MTAKQQVLFVQGGGKGTHDEWDDKLVASLREQLGSSYDVRYPRMPNEDEPSYPEWKDALEKELAALRDGAILVAHSIGGTILLKMLAEASSERSLGGLFLLATPFVGKGGWSLDDLRRPADLGTRLPRGVPVHFFHGVEDETAPLAHVELYARAVPQARVHRLPGRDHQLNSDLTEVARVVLADTD
jgi:predicted alpha/beta hydrolase family esterase